MSKRQGPVRKDSVGYRRLRRQRTDEVMPEFGAHLRKSPPMGRVSRPDDLFGAVDLFADVDLTTRVSGIEENPPRSQTRMQSHDPPHVEPFPPPQNTLAWSHPKEAYSFSIPIRPGAPRQSKTTEKAASFGEFVVCNDGARQIDADIGGGTPIHTGKSSNPARLPNQRRERGLRKTRHDSAVGYCYGGKKQVPYFGSRAARKRGEERAQEQALKTKEKSKKETPQRKPRKSRKTPDGCENVKNLPRPRHAHRHPLPQPVHNVASESSVLPINVSAPEECAGSSADPWTQTQSIGCASFSDK